jgi:hypothetical protein
MADRSLNDRGVTVGKQRLEVLDLDATGAQRLLGRLEARLAAEPHVTDQTVGFGMGGSNTRQVSHQPVVRPRRLHEPARLGRNRSPPAPSFAYAHQNVCVATAVPRVMVVMLCS